MRHLLVLIGIVIVAIHSALAFKSAATFISPQGEKIQIVIDGKLMNAIPKAKVNIAGRPGEHEIGIKIFDSNGILIAFNKDCIDLHPGYKSIYQFPTNNLCGALIKVDMTPYTLIQYKNPEYFYRNKNYAFNHRNSLNKEFDNIMDFVANSV